MILIKKCPKYIPILILLSVILFVAYFSISKQARAFSSFGGAAAVLSVPVSVVADIPYSVKEQIEDTIVRSLARNAQTTLQNGILAKIRTVGRKSNTPAFVQDWRNFLEEAQYRGEDQTRAMIADATLGSNATICQYLRSPLTSAFGAQSILSGFDAFKYRIGSLQYYKERNRCPFPGGFTANDANLFRNDFSAGGGWATWDKLIQSQGNFYGVYADSLDELGKQRGFEEGIDKSEAESGSGFTSKRSSCRSTTSGLSCLVLGDILTPAQILGDSVQRSLDEDLSWITSADEFSELLAGMANALFNSFLTKLDNLSGGVAGSVGTEVFNANACIQECVDVGGVACNSLVEPEFSQCTNDVRTRCSTTCVVP